VPSLKPGLAFWLATDLGYAIGLMTHRIERIGYLIWMAEPVFDQPPRIEDVQQITNWRWPVFFPLSAALRRKIVTPIGVLPIPPKLQAFPLMRSRDFAGGWNLVRFMDDSSRVIGPAADPAIPEYIVVNDTRLKEMLVSGWAPEQNW
jgi:hypothetical protein